MANHEHDITRFSFTPSALRDGPPDLQRRYPGFFEEAEHFGAHLFNGETYFNPVYALVLVIRTKDGDRLLTGVRSKDEKRQPNVGSAITLRRTHAQVRATMNTYSKYRIPILGGAIEDEGYHITQLDPRNPVLVADYEPGAKISADDESWPNGDIPFYDTFYYLIEKIQERGYENVRNRDSRIDDIMQDAVIWPGPELMGVSEVGIYNSKFPLHRDIPMITDPELPPPTNGTRPLGEAILEANDFHTVVGALDLSDMPEATVRKLFFSHANDHYSHFDLARLDSFNYAVRHNVVDLVAPGFEKRSRSQRDMLHLLACAGGLCLRAAAVGLERHYAYIQKVLGDSTTGVYSYPIQLKPANSSMTITDEPIDPA